MALNGDSLVIANHLSQDAALRKSVVDAATNFAQKKPEDGTPAETRLKQDMDSLSALGLPLGWVWPKRETKVNASQPAGVATALDLRQPPYTVAGWLTRILGWLMTAFAISLGAPFWFDLLNKVVGLRSTVKPEPQKAAVKS